MRIEILTCDYGDLRRELLLRLSGHVFHVTNAKGYAGIERCGRIRVEGTEPVTVTLFAPVSFGRQRGYVCLIDLRTASERVIEEALSDYYFLDPFTDSTENVFLVLSRAAHAILVPNHVGVNAPGEAAVPNVEVWYPGEIDLSEVDHAIRVPMSRPNPWDLMLNKEAFSRLFPSD